jgi:putative MFS transporter
MAALILSKRNIISQAAFWLGIVAVAFGVLSHIPMFIEAAPNGYKMAGMPMSAPMLWGMAVIVAGTLLAAYGLLPSTYKQIPHVDIGTIHEAGGGTLTKAHWQLLAVLMAALVIDTMKPITLGFVVPGTMTEYGITQPMVAWLPFCGLTGTMLGSWLWGVLADRLGRRAAILLAAILFIGTSICGAMPTFAWNLVMCFMMGLSAGGMLPIAYTLLAEMIPARHRGWSLVLIGGIGLVGGYFAASGLAHLLEPLYGWRILWLAGLPTGLLLIFFNASFPNRHAFY